MGVIYTVACRDCKVARDLDKFYACHAVDGRESAKVLAHDIANLPRQNFAAALLVSFMAEHQARRRFLEMKDPDDQPPTEEEIETKIAKFVCCALLVCAAALALIFAALCGITWAWRHL